jgi:predicted flap endonuclease-1-like 5' DNA nuclease
MDFQIETLYEESNVNQVEEDESNIETGESDENDLTNVKGIGKGTAENLINYGISSISQLIDSDPEDVASKISGVSSKKVLEWQENARAISQT